MTINDAQQQIIDQIEMDLGLRPNDIICGRSSGKFSCMGGNYAFRKLVSESRTLYEAAERTAKVDISRAVVDAVAESKGRFLFFNIDTDRWEVMPYNKAIEKTSQTFRDMRIKPEAEIDEATAFCFPQPDAQCLPERGDGTVVSFCAVPEFRPIAITDKKLKPRSIGSKGKPDSATSGRKSAHQPKPRKPAVRAIKRKVKASSPTKPPPSIRATPTDILSGRGVSMTKHPANRAFLALIKYNGIEYSYLDDDERNVLCSEIVATIRAGGSRFLTRRSPGGWKESSECQIERKINDALRYNSSIANPAKDTLDFFGICAQIAPVRSNEQPGTPRSSVPSGKLLSTDIIISPKAHLRCHTGNLALEKFIELNREHFHSLVETREVDSAAEIIAAMLHSQGARFVQFDHERKWTEAPTEVAVDMCGTMIDRPQSRVLPGGCSFKYLCKLFREKLAGQRTSTPQLAPACSTELATERTDQGTNSLVGFRAPISDGPLFPFPPLPLPEPAASSHLDRPPLPMSLVRYDNMPPPGLTALRRVSSLSLGPVSSSSNAAGADEFEQMDDAIQPLLTPSSSGVYSIRPTGPVSNEYPHFKNSLEMAQMIGPFESFPAPPEFVCSESFSSVWSD